MYLIRFTILLLIVRWGYRFLSRHSDLDRREQALGKSIHVGLPCLFIPALTCLVPAEPGPIRGHVVLWYPGQHEQVPLVLGNRVQAAGGLTTAGVAWTIWFCYF